MLSARPRGCFRRPVRIVGVPSACRRWATACWTRTCRAEINRSGLLRSNRPAGFNGNFSRSTPRSIGWKPMPPSLMVRLRSARSPSVARWVISRCNSLPTIGGATGQSCHPGLMNFLPAPPCVRHDMPNSNGPCRRNCRRREERIELKTTPPRRIVGMIAGYQSGLVVQEKWCCQTGLNCRPLHYQWSALPLSYGSKSGAGNHETMIPLRRGDPCHKVLGGASAGRPKPPLNDGVRPIWPVFGRSTALWAVPRGRAGM